MRQVTSSSKTSDFREINGAWVNALRAYSLTTIEGLKGPYMPIRPKFRLFMEGMWAGTPGHPERNLPDIGIMLRSGEDVRVFGDPHFGHRNIIKLANRPHLTIEAMDDALWGSIELAHREADFVLCLGDLSLNAPLTWQRKIEQINEAGNATVIGNHDMRTTKPIDWLEINAFASLAFTVNRTLIESWILSHEPQVFSSLDWSLVPSEVHVGISHWPVPPEHLPGPNWVNLHGHSHTQPSRPLRINASLEQINYKPVSITELLDSRIIDDLICRSKGLNHVLQRSASMTGQEIDD